MSAQWEEIGLRKRQDRESKIPPQWKLPAVSQRPANVTLIPRQCGILTEKELDITEGHEARGIVNGVVRGRWTAEEVAIAFCKRAAIAHQLTNCLTEIFFDEAIERGRYLDSYLREHGKPLGPLHGLPISIKDCFSIPNYPSSVGFASRTSTPSTVHSVMSSLLLSAGAILYVKTTTPQGQLGFDTYSSLWGRTLNPHNTSLSAGGSSGGEAALLAMNGSILGIGTDMGGSVRVPAAFCGIYSVKPTSRRIPRQGTEAESIPGSFYSGVSTCVGPMARTAEDCRWFFEVVEGCQPWRMDAQVLPYTFSGRAKPTKLRIGLLASNGVVTPLPPVVAMLERAARALVAAGHDVEHITIPAFPKAFLVMNGFMTLSGTNSFFDALGDEPLSPWLATRMRRKNPKSLEEFYKLSYQRQEVETAFLHSLWERGTEKGRLDVVLCPIVGHPTPKHDDGGGIDWAAVWNLMDYPAGVIPMGTVSEADLKTELSVPSLGRWDEGCRKLWAPDVRSAFSGAPLAVQVVGRKGGDADMCQAMIAIDDVLRHRSGIDSISSSKL